MYDIISIGEILIDLTQCGVNEQGVMLMAANPGGAPANLAVAASRLGCRAAFIGKVGNDTWGKFLGKTLRDNGVETSALCVDHEYPTTLAVVTLDAAGERSFSFYRNPGADTRLSAEEIPYKLLAQTKFFHFGSVGLTAEPERTATMAAVRMAKAAGATITFDPNYRAALWPDKETALSNIEAAISLSDVLKVSDEEMFLLTGEDDPKVGSSKLIKRGITLVLVTLGAAGACFRLGDLFGRVEGIPIKVGDTNGAGDTFLGAFLSCIKESGSVKDLTSLQLMGAISFANKAAAITAGRHGAIPAMPTLAEVLGEAGEAEETQI